MNIYLTAALEYLSLGWSVIPVGRDKKPIVKWKDFQTDAASEDQVRQWFANEHNIAACTGAVSGFVVVDADSDDALERLHKYLGGEPRTAAVKTPRGVHYYFLCPEFQCKNAVSIIPGVDFRGDGGYVLMPPSINEDAVMYDWLVHPSECLMAPLPERIAERVHVDAKNRGRQPQLAEDVPAPPPATAATRYAQVALDAEISTLRNATPGQRNQTLNNCAFSLFQLCAGGELPKSTVESELRSAAMALGLGEDEISKTMRSAESAASKTPRSAPPSNFQPQAAMSLKRPAAAGGEPVDQADVERLIGDYVEKNGSLYYYKTIKAGTDNEERVPTLVSRASARITDEIFLEDGDTTFKIEGETANNRRFGFEITAKEFSEDRVLKAAFVNAAGSDAYIRHGMSKHLGPAIAYLSETEQIDRRTRFKRTGWLDKSTFLMPGRDIGKDELALEKDLPFYSSEIADLPTGLLALRELLASQPMDASTVVITTLFSAALAYHAGWHSNRSGAFITGRTGSLKSSFAGCAMCLFGPEWLNDQNWVSWGDTVNAVISICVQCHDMPILIDNYKPVIHAGPRELIRLIHGIFEGGEKRRLNRNAERRQHRQTLTWPLITGEDVPDCDASTLARLLIVQFPIAGAPNKKHISYAQENSHHLCAVGTAWIDWLATDEGHAAAVEAGQNLTRIRARFSRFLSENTPNMVNVQRVATNLAINFLTWEVMGKCPALAELVSDFASHHEAGLKAVGINMGERTRESLEANRFLDTLGDVLASGKFILVNKYAIMPSTGESVLGWQDSEKIYLLTKPCLKAVTDYLGKDGLGLISERTLFKQLDDTGAVADRGKNTISKLIRCSDEPRRVLVLHRAALWPDVEGDD